MAKRPDDRALGAIFDQAVEAILLADDSGRYIRVNPAAEKLTGYSGDELRAMTVFDLTPAPSRAEGLSMWQAFVQQGTLSGDYALTRKDGSLVEVAFQAVANIMPGVHLSILRDVTARKREDQQLRRAVSLQEATAAMSAAVDTTHVAEVILAAGLEALDAQAGSVVVVVDGRWAEVVATAGMAPGREEEWAEAFRAAGAQPKTVGGRHQFSLEVPTVLVEAFRRGEPPRVEQVVELDPLRARPSFAQLGSATVCLPLVVSGALVGGLYLFWKEKRSFDEDESAFAATLAGLCAQALDRARLFTAEREARERAVASERSILAYQKRLQRMAFDRVVVEERERRRVATALHDGVSQYLALAKMTLDPVRQGLEGGDRTATDAAMKLIAEAIAETRSLSFELSPPLLYDLGIKAALSWLGERLEESTGLRIEIDDDGVDLSLDDVTAAIVFRTVRELLLNVIKHARSPTARVSFRHHPEHLEVVVEDQGTGFDPAATAVPAGFGLMSIREQIGRLGGAVAITSARNQGTRIAVRVPSRPLVDAGSEGKARGVRLAGGAPMQVRTPMTRNVIVVSPTLSVGDAWGILQRENIRHLPVVSDSRIVGMISDRDLLRVGDFLPTRELAFWEQTVGEVMSKAPIVCSPSATVAAAARLMTERKIDALPVVSEHRLVGLVTSTDLLLLLADWAPEHALPFDFRVLEATPVA